MINENQFISVIIVDDDEAFRLLLTRRLENILPGATIEEFDTLQKVRERHKLSPLDPDLVLLDQHLPDGHGLDLMNEGIFENAAVLAVSSDHDPNMPGSAVGAGAAFFLAKKNVADALFAPLVKGLVDRSKLNHQLNSMKVELAVLESVKTLVSTLRHEINNPLGGVLGGAYILKTREGLSPDEIKAAEIVEKSGQRIKHVLDQLCNAVSIDKVNKGGQDVFHVPGDKKWEEEK